MLVSEDLKLVQRAMSSKTSRRHAAFSCPGNHETPKSYSKPENVVKLGVILRDREILDERGGIVWRCRTPVSEGNCPENYHLLLRAAVALFGGGKAHAAGKVPVLAQACLFK